MVPEIWDPESAEDIAYIEGLHGRTALYLHSLSLNPLGDEPATGALKRLRGWRRRLGIDFVSDHFCWTGAGGIHPGVFFPPVERTSEIRHRVATLRDRVECPLVLENIALAGRTPEAALRYHETLTEVCGIERIPVLLDVENIRLDAVAAGLSPSDLLRLYSGLEIGSYHIAGSDAEGEIADTHRHPSAPEAISLLRDLHARRPAPVFYERDYALDADLIAAEVARLDKELRK
jgi:uncharacterized protein (UPF0276 family)